ncbi:Cytochrome c6 [Pontivivens insulae]|uniref:Cytochrome c6 n=2 Tax=Pontivivens insulae TaxID=1639689 RepID=A0A2R8AGG3_9RHOB|nr:cbb3-type cytochrome c oxidase subunit III [Pontivivens insulae]SPF31160.1 Cytochrome c6 [Pontivivens insulae]
MAIAWVLWPAATSAQGTGLRPGDESVVSLGREVYAAECAACHGAGLEGQENWRQRDAEGRMPAPPHDATGHTWHHDGETSFALTKYGVAALIGDPTYQSNMPAYEGVLSDAEIWAVLSYIKSTWPADIRERHDLMEENR